MRLATRLLVLACLAVVPIAPAFAVTTVTLQNGWNGYAGTADNWLAAGQAHDNHGGATDLRIRWNNGRDDCALVRFDLTGKIPSGATILSATLSLYYLSATGFLSDNAVTIKAYRLHPSAWWDENDYPAQSGFGSNYAFRDAGEVYPWTGGAEGGWYDKIEDGNGSVKIKRADGTPPDAIVPGTWAVFDVTASVNQWKSGQANNGFLLIATGFQGGAATCHGTFTSRNDAGASFRPKLTINFEAPVSAEAGAWGRIKALYR